MENDFAEDNYLKLHVKKVFKTRYDFELFSETIVDINEYEKLKASLKLTCQCKIGEFQINNVSLDFSSFRYHDINGLLGLDILIKGGYIVDTTKVNC
ncbi:hypothetical protein HK1_00761 [Tepidibacillus sp. HK-1]|nr:hypothetical protein HK1_00761 [Tepidibacillus sp. HK-1]